MSIFLDYFRKTRNQIKENIKIISSVAIFIIACIVMPTSNASKQSDIAVSAPESQEVINNLNNSTDIDEVVAETADTSEVSNVVATSEMKVHFIDVGLADYIFIESVGKYMLVDTGNDEDSSVITTYLKNKGVEKLDFVIATFPMSIILVLLILIL